MRKTGTVCVALLLAGPAVAQETAQDVLDRAIKAHGGAAQLAKARADRVKIKGHLVLNDKEVPFTGEVLVQLPGRFRSTLTVNNAGRAITIVQVLNGDKAWVSVDGQNQKIEPSALAEMRAAFHVQQALRLLPLRQGRGQTVALLPDVKISDRPAAVLKVSAAGRPDLLLFFDRASGVLVKAEHTVGDGAGKDAKQEVIFGDYRDVGGYLRPLKMDAYRDGKKIMSAELTDVKYFDRFDDAEFDKP
jgi:hypothetical protein